MRDIAEQRVIYFFCFFLGYFEVLRGWYEGVQLVKRYGTQILYHYWVAFIRDCPSSRHWHAFHSTNPHIHVNNHPHKIFLFPILPPQFCSLTCWVGYSLEDGSAVFGVNFRFPRIAEGRHDMVSVRDFFFFQLARWIYLNRNHFASK